MKWRNRSYLTVFSVIALMQGCQLAPHTVHIVPKVEDHRSNAGQGKLVALAVKDVRPQKKVGIVGDPKAKSVEVSAEDESTSGIYNAAAEALRHLGFVVRPYSEGDDPSLRIELRELEYQSVKLPFTFETKGKATLSVLAQNAGDRYQRTYKVNKAFSTGTPPSASDIDREVDDLVSMAMEDMITDEDLITVLAKGGG